MLNSCSFLKFIDKLGHPVTRHADNSWFFRATFAQNFYFEPREGEEKKIAGQPHWRISSLISIRCRTGFNSNENAVAKGEGKKRKKKNIAQWNSENPLAYLQTNKEEWGGDDDNFNAEEPIVKCKNDSLKICLWKHWRINLLFNGSWILHTYILNHNQMVIRYVVWFYSQSDKWNKIGRHVAHNP